MYKLVPRQKPVGAPQINFPAYRKASSTERKNFLFDRSDSNDLINGVLKPSHVILSKTTFWSSVPNAFCRSITIIPVCIPLYMSIKTKSFSCTRHESLEKFTLKLKNLVFVE